MRKCTMLYIFLLVVMPTFSQGKLKKAEAALSNQDYTTALSIFQGYYDKHGDENPYVVIDLANCYYYLDDNNEAKFYFDKANPDHMAAQDFLHYGYVLKASGHYKSALAQYDIGRVLSGDAQMDEKFKAAVHEAQWALDNHNFFNPEVNVVESKIPVSGVSIGLQYYYDGVVYAYVDPEEKRGLFGKPSDMHLYYISVMSDAYLSKPIRFSKNLSAKRTNITSSAFVDEGRTVLFTSKNEAGVSQVYASHLDEKTVDWDNPTLMDFCEPEVSYVHLSVSADGSTLYFASDMEGGYGGMDIYKVNRNGEEWGEPVNMGDVINSYRDEIYPTISPSGELSFSSDGHEGFGGLDVFHVIAYNGEPVDVINAQRPINSGYDDFSLVVSPYDELTGYLSSNRGEQGIDDKIFEVTFTPEYYANKLSTSDEEENLLADEDSSFVIDTAFVAGGNDSLMDLMGEQEVEYEPLDDEPNVDFGEGFDSVMIDESSLDGEITGIVSTSLMCSASDRPVMGADFEIVGLGSNEVLATGVTGDEGVFTIDLAQITAKGDDRYTLVAKGGDGEYPQYTMDLMLSDLIALLEDGTLAQAKPVDEEAQELSFVVDEASLGGNFFEYNDDELTDFGRQYLSEWADKLVQNPTQRIKLMCHTDKRGSLAYNFYLSQRRAFSAKFYLMIMGVDHMQVIGRGYGERYPVINKAEMTDEEHAKNRRVEIEIFRPLDIDN